MQIRRIHALSTSGVVNISWLFGLVCLLSSKTLFAVAPLIAFPEPNQEPNGTNPSVWNLGFQFQVEIPVTVISLGTIDIDADGFSQQQHVGLWSVDDPDGTTGSLLTSTFIDSTDPLDGLWRFKDIQPIQLLPSKAYILSTQGGALYTAKVEGLTVNPYANFVEGKSVNLGTSSNDPLVFPTESGATNPDGTLDPMVTFDEGGGFFGPNAKLTALSSISLPTDILDQIVDVAFPVTIEAVRSDGQRDTSYNGEVALSTNYSSHVVSPRTVTLIEGFAQVDEVTINGIGVNVQLEAMDQSVIGVNLVGTSNAFHVSDPASVPGTLNVTIHPNGQVSLPLGVRLYLEGLSSGDKRSHDQIVCAPIPGCHYVFEGVDAGLYMLSLESPLNKLTWGRKQIEIIGSTEPWTQNEIIRFNDDRGSPPVLVIPGILGSTDEGDFDYSSTNAYPQLSGIPPESAEKLRILNNFFSLADAGFDGLEDELWPDYRVYLVPWDWRLSLAYCQSFASDCKNAWKEYLIPALDIAKDPDGDGIDEYPKVDVVAHSMGGLLVRAYIQSPEYRGDIDKFAMVGTPNEGSAKAYFMVQGGDPFKADFIGPCPPCASFYSLATDALYKEMESDRIFGCTSGSLLYEFICISDLRAVLDRSGLIKFYAENIKTGRQLLPTYRVLRRNGSDPGDLNDPLVNMPNTFLRNLNSYVETSGRFTTADDLAPGASVRTMIFASNDKWTLSVLNVSEPLPPPVLPYAVYPDGTPVPPQLRDRVGDGTVTVCSAAKMGNDCEISDVGTTDLGWATLTVKNKGSHTGLMGEFKSEIHLFLNDGRVP